MEIDNKINNDINTVNKQYKTPEYTRRAIKNYEQKNKDDPEFKQKKIEINKNYREKNADKIRDYKRNYMREYRAKKKADKVIIPINNSNTANDITDVVNTLTINN